MCIMYVMYNLLYLNLWNNQDRGKFGLLAGGRMSAFSNQKNDNVDRRIQDMLLDMWSAPVLEHKWLGLSLKLHTHPCTLGTPGVKEGSDL